MDKQNTVMMGLTTNQMKAMGLSGGAGLCTGMAVKHIGKQVGILMGVTFLGLQTLQHFGYVSVNWEKADKDFKKVLGEEGDGDDKTLINAQSAFHKICTANLPNATGFSAGLLIGLGM